MASLNYYVGMLKQLTFQQNSYARDPEHLVGRVLYQKKTPTVETVGGQFRLYAKDLYDSRKFSSKSPIFFHVGVIVFVKVDALLTLRSIPEVLDVEPA